MPAPLNPLKQALSQGQTQYGIWMGLGEMNTAEIMGTAGFDFLVVDNEHSPRARCG